ncbi:hypothetical protein CD798_09660 [Bacillaceae bacterium SAOS 7]|nr:hypothetical protein CD798_09660 [Bacillaceae bacterium SAOS 7]
MKLNARRILTVSFVVFLFFISLVTYDYLKFDVFNWSENFLKSFIISATIILLNVLFRRNEKAV